MPTPLQDAPHARLHDDSLAAALARLEPADSALLEMSLRHAIEPREIAGLSESDPVEVEARIEAALAAVAGTVGARPPAVRFALRHLPASAWSARPEPKPARAEPQPLPERPPAQRRLLAAPRPPALAANVSRAVAVGGVGVAGVAAGALAASGSAAVAFGLVGVLALLPVILRRPDVGALLMLVLVALVPRSTLFEKGIPIGGGALKVTDLLLAVTLGSWLLASSRRPERHRLPARAVLVPIGVMLVLALASVLTAQAHGSSFKLALLELRPLLSYLLVIPLVGGMTSTRAVERGVAVMLAACGISAIELIWKYVHGQGSVASYSGGAIRVDAVFLYPLVGAIWCMALGPFRPSPRLRAVLVTLAVICLTGLFFTFQRGAWLALVIGVGAVVALLPGSRRRRLVAAAVPVLAAIALAVTALNASSTSGAANPLSSGIKRFSSLGQYQSDVSNRYRIAEWTRAGEVIGEHPLMGIGLGNSITFWSPMYSDVTHQYGGTYSTFYIHNSYIWLALKMGIPGLLGFLWMIGAALVVGLRRYRAVADPRLKRLLLAASASMIAILALSLSGPHLTVDNATPLVAALIALIAGTARIAEREPAIA